MEGDRLPKATILAAGLCMAVLLLWIGGVGAGTVFHASAARNHIFQGIAYARNLDVTALQRELSAAQERIESAQRIARLARPLEYIPILGSQFSGLRSILDASWYSLRSADQLAGAGADIVAALSVSGKESTLAISRIDFDAKGRLLSAMRAAEPSFAAARAESSLALRELSQTEKLRLISPLRSTVQDLKDKHQLLQEWIPRIQPFLAAAPSLLGYPQQQTYLFLLQNNTEVRATGGFIGNYGILKVHNGAVSSFFTDNIYNLDDAAAALSVMPPRPLAVYFPKPIQKWFLRDSNWSPDFPTAARQAAWFYAKEGGRERLDGVISITPEVLISLLKIVGPLDVDDITFTADNFLENLQYHVEKGYVDRGIAEPQRKEIVGKLARMLLEQVEGMDLMNIQSILSLLQARADEKHILVHFFDQDLQKFAVEQGWGGEISQPEGDFLMVVDSNMASMKTDIVMDKHIAYSLREEVDGTLYGRVTLTYRNNGRFSWNTTRYRDYVRVYVPDGSQVIGARGTMKRELSDEPGTLELSREHGKMSIGTYVVVEPRETKSVIIEYRLPIRIADQARKKGVYTLFVQKQSGVSNQKFSADMIFRRPLTGYEPTGVLNAQTSESGVHLISDLRVDRNFSVDF